MRTLRYTSLLALLLLTVLAAAQTTRAAAAASGSYQFTATGDEYRKSVEFDARARAEGGADGYISVTDEAFITTGDVDGTGEPEQRFAGYSFRAEVDSLVVDRNQAVLSGTIRTASNELLIGRRVLLTIEDNGDNARLPDRLSWNVYNPVRRDWVASDAELREDPGVGLRWWATDAERREDTGYQMPRSENHETRSFPVAADDFIDAENVSGDIRVSP